MEQQNLGSLFSNRRFAAAYRFLDRYCQPGRQRPDFINPSALAFEITSVLLPRIDLILRLAEPYQPELIVGPDRRRLSNVVPNIGGLSLLHAHRLSLLKPNAGMDEPAMGVWAATSRPHPRARLSFLYLSNYITTDASFGGAPEAMPVNEVFWERDEHFSVVDIIADPPAVSQIDLSAERVSHQSVQKYGAYLIDRIADLTGCLSQYAQAA